MQTSTLSHEAVKLIEKGIRIGMKKGIRIGIEKGIQIGISRTLEMLKPAISDGLRHASPVCASMMRFFRK